MKLEKKPLKEVAKSFLRFMWFGSLGLVGAFLTSLLADGSLADTRVTIAGVSLNVGLLVVAGVGLVVKALDRYVKYSKAIDLKGLAPPILQK